MKDDDTRSLISMQELDPSPVTDDLEQGDYFQDAVESQGAGSGFFGQRLGLGAGLRSGLKSGSWDSWCMSCQKTRPEKN